MKPLLKHYDNIIQSEVDVDKLKKTIIELGISGRLTEQSNNYKSIDELLTQIKMKKKVLIDNKVIKKGREYEPPNESGHLFTIPPQWKWVRLSDVGRIVGGGTPKTKEPKYWAESGKGIPWITPADIGSKQKTSISRGRRDITDSGLKNSSTHILPKGSVLFSSRAPIGYVAIANNDICTNQGFKSVLPYEMEMNRYIFYYLKWAGEKINDKASGTTFKEVSGREMEKQLFPLPPLEEQKRIVKKIDRLFKLCDQLTEQIYSKNKLSIKLNATIFNRIQDVSNRRQKEYLAFTIQNMDSLCNNKDDVNLLKESLLSLAVQGKLVRQDSNDEPASALIKKIEKEREQLIRKKQIRRQRKLPEITDEEKPYELPEGWEWVRLGDISNYGQADKADKDKLTGKEWILELGDIEKDSSVILQRVLVKDRSFKSAKNEFKKDDVLFGKLRPYLNKVVVADMAGICSTEIVPIRLYSEIDSFFIKYVLKSPYFMNYVDSLMAGVKMPRLRTEDGRMAISPLPPLNEQRRIVERLNKLLDICNLLEERFEKRELSVKKLRNAVLSETSIHNYEAIVS